jgi:hypothetical protein
MSSNKIKTSLGPISYDRNKNGFFFENLGFFLSKEEALTLSDQLKCFFEDFELLSTNGMYSNLTLRQGYRD